MDSHCVQSHKVNYLRYSERFGVEDARYLPTSIGQPVVVGDYQSMAILGESGFGVIHLVVHTRTGATGAMKMISRGKPSNSKEVGVMQKLHHVSQNLST